MAQMLYLHSRFNSIRKSSKQILWKIVKILNKIIDLLASAKPLFRTIRT